LCVVKQLSGTTFSPANSAMPQCYRTLGVTEQKG